MVVSDTSDGDQDSQNSLLEGLIKLVSSKPSSSNIAAIKRRRPPARASDNSKTLSCMHLALLKLIRFSWAYFSSLSRSLWTVISAKLPPIWQGAPPCLLADSLRVCPENHSLHSEITPSSLCSLVNGWLTVSPPQQPMVIHTPRSSSLSPRLFLGRGCGCRDVTLSTPTSRQPLS